jgi:hypothetical protein
VNAVRAPAIVALLALLIGALVFAADPESPRLADGMVQAVAERSGSADIWFCEGPTPESPGVDDRVVALTNPTGSVAEGRITVVDESGQRVSRTYQVEAGGRFEFRPDPFVPDGRFAAVTVEVPEGGLFVDQRIVGDESVGRDDGPCATVTSASWRHPWGSTERPGTSAVLLLHNPYPGTAVADIRLIGDLGRRESLDSQGVVVAGRSLVAYDLTERIADSEVVSAVVDVRVGQLVTALFQYGDGTSPNAWHGIDLSLGAPGDAGRLFLPGPAAADEAALVVLLNAGDETVDVEVVVHPISGEVVVEPFRVVLRAGRREVLDLFGDRRLDGVGTFLIEVRSLDAPTVAASLVTRAAVGGEADPENGVAIGPVGLDVATAVDHAATTWWVRTEPSASGESASLVVFNPAGAGIAAIDLSLVSMVDDDGSVIEPLPRHFELDPGTQVEFPLPPGVVEVVASAPVVVVARQVGTTGRTSFVGTAAAGTVVRPS